MQYWERSMRKCSYCVRLKKYTKEWNNNQRSPRLMLSIVVVIGVIGIVIVGVVGAVVCIVRCGVILIGDGGVVVYWEVCGGEECIEANLGTVPLGWVIGTIRRWWVAISVRIMIRLVLYCTGDGLVLWGIVAEGVIRYFAVFKPIVVMVASPCRGAGLRYIVIRNERAVGDHSRRGAFIEDTLVE